MIPTDNAGLKRSPHYPYPLKAGANLRVIQDLHDHAGIKITELDTNVAQHKRPVSPLDAIGL